MPQNGETVVRALSNWWVISLERCVRRCSPVQFLGPKRVVAPALNPEDPELPNKLDFVLLSHNHYDHLDAGSVHRLNKRYGSKLLW